MNRVYLAETVFFSARLKEEFKTEWETLKIILNEHRIKTGMLDGTKDIWCRDYMPVPVGESEYVQFTYGSSYLQDPKYDHVRTIPDDIPQREQFNPIRSKIVLDGGNVVRCQDTVLISERAKTDNPGWDARDLHQELENRLKAEVIWIPDHGIEKDMNGHADGLVRFVDNCTLLVNDRKKDYADWVRRFDKAIAGRGFHVEDVPFFDYVPPELPESAIGCYLNFLEVGDLVLVPVFDSPGLPHYYRKKAETLDREALEKFKGWFPHHTILGIQINRIAERGGLINCITWDIRTPVPRYRETPIIPVYGEGSGLLVIRTLDFSEGVAIDDGYAVYLDLNTLAHTAPDWGQVFLKFDPMAPITQENRDIWIQKMVDAVPCALIEKIATELNDAYKAKFNAFP